MIVSPSGNIGCDLSAHFAGCGVLSYRSDATYGRDEAGSPKWWFDLSSGGTPQLGGRSEGAFSLDEAFRGGGSSSPQWWSTASPSPSGPGCAAPRRPA